MKPKLQNRKVLCGVGLLLGVVLLLATMTLTQSQVAYGAPSAVVLYAKPNGATSGSCDNWTNACNLSIALSTAFSGTNTEIWVAAGTYTPTVGVTRTATFLLKNNVALYGGFAQTETLRDQRNWATNVTILSGDIGAKNVFSDNAYHILRSINTNSTAILDGFTVRDGNAFGGDYTEYEDIGAGLCNCGDGNYPDNIPGGSPTVRNMIFYNNYAVYSGAAMFNWVNSSPLVSNVLFISNSIGTYGYGGAMDNYNNSNPTLINVTFMSNTSGYAGGALSARLNSSPVMTNVLFVRNKASAYGGAIHNELQSYPLLTHVTFAYNTSGDLGGAISNYQTSGNSESGHVIIRNGILWGNTAAIVPATNQIDNNLTNTVAVLTYTDIQGGYSGTGNLSGDPLFVNAAGNNYRLSGTPTASPAINTGFNLGVSTDLDGNPRDSQPDMGAYEYVDTTPISGLTASNNSPTTFGSLTTFTATVSAGTGVSYQWNYGDGQLSSGAVTTHTYGAVNIYTAIVTATNSVNAVTATTRVTITEVPIAGLAASNNSPTVFGNSTTLTASISAGTNVSYQWNYGDGGIGNTKVTNHTYGAIGTFTAVVTATNSSSGPIVATTRVTITDVPIAGLKANNNSPTIIGNTTTLTATVTAGTSVGYQWNYGDGQTGGGASSNHTYSTIGIYTAVVTATNSANTVVATTRVTITDVPIAGLAASNNSPTIFGNLTNLTATVSAGTGISYQWNYGDGQPTGSGASTTHTYGAIGTYTARITATNSANTLVATTRVTITDVPIAGLTASNDGPTLLGNLTTLTATISAGTNVSYQWNFGDGGTGNTRVANHTFGLPTVYTVMVTATNSDSGPVVATTLVSVEDVPIAGLTASSNSPTLLGSLTTLTATTSAGTSISYQWDFGDGGTGTTKVANHTYGAVGVYTAVVTATNSASGPIVATTQVTIADVPIAGLAANNSSPTLLGGLTTLTATTSAGTNISYQWDFGDVEVGSGRIVTHTYAATGVYVATLHAANGSSGPIFATTMVTVVDAPIAGLIASNDSPTQLGSLTTLNASITGGTNVSYDWVFGDGTMGVGKVVTHTYVLTGTYIAVVTATNSASGPIVATTSVSITNVPDVPISGLLASNNSPTQVNLSTAFSATIITGTHVVYEWNFGDGHSGSGAFPNHPYTATGIYIASVRAANDTSGPLTATTRVTITDVPIGSLTASNNGPKLVHSTISLTATESAGTNVMYQWNFGDGVISAASNALTAVHTYDTYGTFTAIVTATNGSSLKVATTPVVIKPYQIYLPLALKNH